MVSPQADWVKNSQAAGWGILARNRREERASILREFPRKVPYGVQFFVRAGIVEAPDPESLAAAAPRCTVFRIEDRADEPTLAAIPGGTGNFSTFPEGAAETTYLLPEDDL